jgi:hypothetical protein
MNFKKGDLAVITGGSWTQSIGLVVEIVWQCRASHGRGVRADGLAYWMPADGPIYVVKTVGGSLLPAGLHNGKVLHWLKRRPYCRCHLMPLIDAGIDVSERAEKELEAA